MAVKRFQLGTLIVYRSTEIQDPMRCVEQDRTKAKLFLKSLDMGILDILSKMPWDYYVFIARDSQPSITETIGLPFLNMGFVDLCEWVS